MLAFLYNFSLKYGNSEKLNQSSSGHLFMTYFYRAGGRGMVMAPSAPCIRYCNHQCKLRIVIVH